MTEAACSKHLCHALSTAMLHYFWGMWEVGGGKGYCFSERMLVPCCGRLMPGVAVHFISTPVEVPHT
jgi:hypothetical protein